MTLQAFVSPAACDTPSAPVALVADYPVIEGWTPNGGYGASFQVYDTATCTPLPIGEYTFEYAVDDPAVAVVTETGPIGNDGSATAGTEPADIASATTSQASPRPEFDDIKARVGLNFTGPGHTTLHVTASDLAGNIIGTVDIPISVAYDPTVDTIVEGTKPPLA